METSKKHTQSTVMSSIKHEKSRLFFSCNAFKTHTSAVCVDDADSQRAVLHVALEVEHGALTGCHRHVAQLSCEKERDSQTVVTQRKSSSAKVLSIHPDCHGVI